MSIAFISDTHLDPGEPERIQNFGRFLDFLETRCSALYILGDLFNFWLGAAQFKIMAMRQVVTSLQKFSSRKDLFFLPGNRDFLFTPCWKRMGGKTIKDGAILEMLGMRMVLYHGDALCIDDKQYQRMKRVAQSRLAFSLSSLISANLCLKIGYKLRQISQAVQKNSTQNIEASIPYISQIMEANHADVMICGHSHLQKVLSLKLKTREATVFFLPASTENLFEFLLWDDNGKHYFENYAPA